MQAIIVTHPVKAEIGDLARLVLDLDETVSPRTVNSILSCLPITVGINVWGEELYTDKIPVMAESENSKHIVDLMDVAYWPPGNAICLFFGPTPVSRAGEIRPYSPVNVIGKIRPASKDFIKKIQSGAVASLTTL